MKKIIKYVSDDGKFASSEVSRVEDTFDDYFDYNFQYQLDDYCDKFEEYCFVEDDRKYIYDIERYDV